MDTSVIRDTSDIEDAPVPATPAPAAETRGEGRSVRRFTFDPASSPVLRAALAWEAVGPRR